MVVNMKSHLRHLVLVVLTSGCVEVDGPPVQQEVQPQSPCPAGTPKRKAVPPDLIDAFPACCQGRGALIPSFLIPSDFHQRLSSGPQDTLCVPREFATDADYTPRKCLSVFGLKGACLSPCLPDVQNASITLPKADCPADQVCAPCVDPTTKKETGACDFGLMACEDPGSLDDCTPLQPEPSILSQFETCCEKGPAHCASVDFVPADQRKDLNTCPDGQSYCVPDEILVRGGKHQPATCKSVGGREGRCLSVCVKSVADQLDLLPVSSCQPHERCAPCYDPRTGMGTGACTVGPCDKPKDPPKTFEKCGGGTNGEGALCVPSSLVAGKDRCNFDNIGCKAGGCTEPGTLCVPQKMIDAGSTFEPKKCEASMSGYLALFMTIFNDPFSAFSKMEEYADGRCISKCMRDVRLNPSASLLGSSGCDSDEICVPCYDPQKLEQGKVPTGACHRKPCPGFE
jgi:hypothetical protein